MQQIQRLDGGGGGTFITKVNDSSTYTLTAKIPNEKVTPLLIAAGGNGGSDSIYQYTAFTNGADGRYTVGGLGTGFTTKFLTSPNGTTYSRGGLTSVGGYGGGTGSDDSSGYGGGANTSSSGATSYNVGINAGGATGVNNGNGRIVIDGISAGVGISNVIVSGNSVSFKLNLNDNAGGSGIDFTKTKYIVDTISTFKGVNSSEWNGSSAYTVTGSGSIRNATISTTSNSYIHILAVDLAGNTNEVVVRLVDNIKPEITLTNTSGENSYPVVIKVDTSDSDSGIDYIIMPDGSRCYACGDKTFTTTYNVTKNGEYAFTAVDKFGNQKNSSIIVTNVRALIVEATTSQYFKTINIGTKGTTAKVNIDWGDGTIEEINQSSNISHTYNSIGVFNIKITGRLPKFDIGGYLSGTIGPGGSYLEHNNTITDIKQWGVLETSWFRFIATKIKNIPQPHPKSFEKMTDFSYVFYSCEELIGPIPSGFFDGAPLVTSFEGTFYDCKKLSGDIPSGLFDNNSLATSFRGTFGSSYTSPNKLTKIPSGLFNNNPLATDFYETFSYCTSLSGNIPSGLFLNNPLVTTFEETFYQCSNLTGSIPSNLFSTNTLVTNFDSIFYGCEKLTGSIPSNLFANNKEVTSMCCAFQGCKGLEGAIPYNLFYNNKKVDDFSGIFRFCTGLTSIPGELFKYNTQVGKTHDSFFNGFALAFEGCSGLTGSIPYNLFANNTLVTSFYGTFQGCEKLTGAIPGELFANCPLVTTFETTFYKCKKLTGISPGLFSNNPKVEDFHMVFYECNNLTGPIPADLFANCPLVTTYYGVFGRCEKLTGTIPENLFANSPKATNFSYTFQNTYSMEGSIPNNLFANNPLANNFSYTFHSCSNYTGVAPELWTRTGVTSSTQCFYGCIGLSNYSSIPSSWK